MNEWCGHNERGVSISYDPFAVNETRGWVAMLGRGRIALKLLVRPCTRELCVAVDPRRSVLDLAASKSISSQTDLNADLALKFEVRSPASRADPTPSLSLSLSLSLPLSHSCA